MSWRKVTAQSCVPAEEGREQGDSNANNPLIQVQLCLGFVIPCLTTSPGGDRALFLSSSLTWALPASSAATPSVSSEGLPVHAGMRLQEGAPALHFHLCFGAGCDPQETFLGKGSAVGR